MAEEVVMVFVVVEAVVVVVVELLERLRLLSESSSACTSWRVSERDSCVVKQFRSSASSALPEHSRNVCIISITWNHTHTKSMLKDTKLRRIIIHSELLLVT